MQECDVKWVGVPIKFINDAVNALCLKRNEEVSIGSRLKIENRSMFATSAFYAVAGIIFFVLLVLTNFATHLGIIGIFRLVTANGLFTKRAWTVWFVIILFFVATTFSAFMIYNVLGTDYLLGIGDRKSVV